MNFTLAPLDAQKSKGDALVLPLFDTDVTDKKKLAPALVRLDEAVGGVLARALHAEGFKAKAEQSFTLHTHGKVPFTHLIVVGLGPRARFTGEVLRLAAGRAVKLASKLRARAVAVELPAVPELEVAVRAVVEGFVLGAYRYDRWRSKDDNGAAPSVDKVQLVVEPSRVKERAILDALSLGEAVAGATNWARDLVNEPAGTMTPTILADAAVAMARQAGLKVSVKDRAGITALKMGMFLGVAQGSDEAPRLVQVSYLPKGKDAKKPPLCLVGKAITFDSGGYSLKPTEGMLDMKTDMAGSAAVLGAMKVVAELAPPFPVHAFLGACENMVSGHAYRLGDVLVSRLGKTVEITNTDAEGRLVLGDVLAYANELEPRAIVDLATLTGACIIALGNHITGVFGEDDPLVYDVLEAARAAGEEMWRLPISELQRDALKSEIADLKNAGERAGGAINAALFLREFVGKTPWVHLDIAGPSQSPKERGYLAKGATGVGVRTLVELVRRHAALGE